MRHLMVDARPVPRLAWDRHTRALLDVMVAAGHRVSALCAPGQGLPAGVEAVPVSVEVDAWGRSEAFALLGWPALVERHRPDVVLGACGIVPLGRCAARRVVLVADVARRVRLAASVSAADSVVVASRWLADEVRLVHPHARLKVLPPLLDARRPSDVGARVRLNGLGLVPRQYFCVPFTPQARDALPTLLEAFGALPLEVDAQLVLMSTETDWNVEAHVDLLDEEHRDAVLLTGELDDATRRDVLRHAGALLHPCVHEGVLLEALEGDVLGTPLAERRGSP